jgi:hypothetical protein
MAANYEVDYNDKRFTEVKADEKAALSDLEKTYGGMISNSEKYYQAQIDASKDWAETQKKNQQAQTDFAIEQVNQQKAQAKQDYTKEQSGAYVDWQKQSGKYGVNAEQMAAQGMQNTGYSESSQVSMYNTYQNRVVAARESYQRAILNYDNAIKDARLQNNSVLAQIAYEALQQQLELSLQGFQYKNQLILDKANKKTELEKMYHDRYQDVLKQINTENALAEEVRQYNNNLQLQREQLQLQKDQFTWQKEQASKTSSGSGKIKGSSGGSGSGGKNTSNVKDGSKGTGGHIAAGVAAASNNKVVPDRVPTVDMSSVLALGFGPISAARLDELIRQGLVEEYQDGSKLKYRKVVK